METEFRHEWDRRRWLVDRPTLRQLPATLVSEIHQVSGERPSVSIEITRGREVRRPSLDEYTRWADEQPEGDLDAAFSMSFEHATLDVALEVSRPVGVRCTVRGSHDAQVLSASRLVDRAVGKLKASPATPSQDRLTAESSMLGAVLGLLASMAITELLPPGSPTWFVPLAFIPVLVGVFLGGWYRIVMDRYHPILELVELGNPPKSSRAWRATAAFIGGPAVTAALGLIVKLVTGL